MLRDVDWHLENRLRAIVISLIIILGFQIIVKQKEEVCNVIYKFLLHKERTVFSRYVIDILK